MENRLLLALTCGLVGSVTTQAWAAPVDLTIKNSSDWTLDELYLSPSKENEWGPDQLEDKVIQPGESFTLRGVPGGKAMDMRLVDEDGDECVVKDKFAANTSYTITSSDLLGCQDVTQGDDDEDA
jgi:hypothetical protein